MRFVVFKLHKMSPLMCGEGGRGGKVEEGEGE